MSASGQPGGALTRLDAGALTPGAVALSLVGIGLAVITQESLVRRAEARAGAELARVVGLVPARAVGSAVVFPIRGRFVGYAVTEGCTVAFLVAPFFFIAAMLIAGRLTPLRRGLGALAVITVVFLTVNQARLFVVAASMRGWGFRSGYERSHVFLGTILSALGALVGLLLFVWLVVKGGRPRGERGDGWPGAG